MSSQAPGTPLSSSICHAGGASAAATNAGRGVLGRRWVRRARRAFADMFALRKRGGVPERKRCEERRREIRATGGMRGALFGLRDLLRLGSLFHGFHVVVLVARTFEEGADRG